MGRCRTTAPHASHPTYSLTKPLTLPAMHSLHRTMLVLVLVLNYLITRLLHYVC